MGKNKLKKFDQIKSYNHVIEKSFSELKQGFNLKGVSERVGAHGPDVAVDTHSFAV